MSHPIPTMEYGEDNGQEPDLEAIAEERMLITKSFSLPIMPIKEFSRALKQHIFNNEY